MFAKRVTYTGVYRAPTNGIRDLRHTRFTSHTMMSATTSTCNEMIEWVRCKGCASDVTLNIGYAVEKRDAKIVDKGTEKERSMRFAKSRHFVLWTEILIQYARLFLALNFWHFFWIYSREKVFQRLNIRVWKYLQLYVKKNCVRYILESNFKSYLHFQIVI